MDHKDSSAFNSGNNETSSAVAEAIEFGIDISLLESTLTCSYQERLERHESALTLVLELKRAGEQLSKA